MEAISKQKKIKFLMLAGSSLHRYGASADRVEKAMSLMSEKLGIKGDFFSTPTGLFACFKIDGEVEETRLKRLDIGKVNLSKLLYVDQVIDKVLFGILTIDEGVQRIEKIINDRPLYKDIWVNLSYAIISICLVIFFGGNHFDMIFSAVLGFLVGLFSETIRIERINSISDGVLAFFVSLCALLLSHFIPGLHPNIITLSSLIILIPGLMLTTAINELSASFLTSGTSRLLGSIVILLKISFGVYLAHIAYNFLGFSTYEMDKQIYSPLTKVIITIICAFSFTLNFQARFQEIFWIIGACLVSFFTYDQMSLHFSDAMAIFSAGCLLAAFSHFFSRVAMKPALIALLPGIILLVPGSIGYLALEYMFRVNDPVAGFGKISQMLLMATALVSGTYFGSVLIKPKRTL